MNILLIDNSKMDRELMRMLLLGPDDEPWLRNCRIESIPEPFTVLDDYLDWDGVIFDERLGPDVLGSVHARTLHLHGLPHDKRYNRLAKMLLTASPELLPADAYSFVDAVATKHLGDGVVFDRLDPLWVGRAWARNIQRVLETKR